VALSAASLGAGAGVASCTFLVQFHDEPGGCDGAFCVGDGPAVDVTGGDVVVVEAGMDTGKPPAEGGPDTYAPCRTAAGAPLASGYYCATDGLNGFMGSQDDLVNCVDGGIGKVTLCDGGCLPLPAPFPDACNPCPGVADGTYCGRDLPGFPADNADFLIQCQTSNAVMTVACAHGCDSVGKTSSCYP